VDEDTATALYFGCMQNDTCTLANHKKQFDSYVAGMVASGGKQPDAEKLATRFISSLDPKRYSQLKVDLENQTRVPMSYPKLSRSGTTV
jgi:hypothetical protein